MIQRCIEPHILLRSDASVVRWLSEVNWVINLKSIRKKIRNCLTILCVGCLVVFGFSAGFSGCMSFRTEPEVLKTEFLEEGLVAPKFDIVTSDDDWSIHMATVEGEFDWTVVFVHGSPGSLDAFISFLKNDELRSRVRLVSVDRPGFGLSDPGEAVPSIEEQAFRIRHALVQKGIEGNVILVGHSLGGAVVARIAVDYPELARGLILVAPSVDPDLVGRRWYNYLAKFPLVYWGLSRDWKNSNDEIYPLREQMELLKNRLDTLSESVIVIQGMKDRLVHPENADFIERELRGAERLDVWRIEDMNHFVPWTHPELIERAIYQLLEEVER